MQMGSILSPFSHARCHGPCPLTISLAMPACTSRPNAPIAAEGKDELHAHSRKADHAEQVRLSLRTRFGPYERRRDLCRQQALWNEIVRRGNTVVLTYSQLVDSRGFFSLLSHRSYYESFVRLFEEGHIRMSLLDQH